MFFYVPSVGVLFPRMDLSLIKQKETTHTHNRAHACCSFCHHSYFFFFRPGTQLRPEEMNTVYVLFIGVWYVLVLHSCLPARIDIAAATCGQLRAFARH